MRVKALSTSSTATDAAAHADVASLRAPQASHTAVCTRQAVPAVVDTLRTGRHIAVSTSSCLNSNYGDVPTT